MSIPSPVDPAKLPRGIRNNNPMNIRRDGTAWFGMALDQDDPEFVVFDKPEYGIRAGARILKTYAREGITTIREAITRWAPPVENNTQAYITNVCAACALDQDQTIDLNSQSILFGMVKAIILQEEGTNHGDPWYADELITYGISLQ